MSFISKHYPKLFFSLLWCTLFHLSVAETPNWTNVYNKTVPGVVKIYVTKLIPNKRTRGKRKPKYSISGATGSGFLINEFGNVVTNEHVIEWAPSPEFITVHFPDGMEYACDEITYIDFDHDLCILHIPHNEHKRWLPLLPDSDAAINEPLCAIGCPLSFDFTSEPGYITALTPFPDDPYLEMSNASLTYGNSGCPLINTSGQVIGIAKGILDSRNMKDHIKVGEKNFAIKVSTLREILDDQDIRYHTESLFQSSNQPISQVQDTLLFNADRRRRDSLNKANEIYRDSLNRIRTRDSVNQASITDSLKNAAKQNEITNNIRLQNSQAKNQEDEINTQEEMRKALLPKHFEFKLSGGGGFYGGQIADNPDFVNSNNTFWYGSLMLAYRFDSYYVNERGNLVGLFSTIGSPNTSYIGTILAQEEPYDKFPQAFQQKQFYELEASFVFGEWFRLSFGGGRQYYLYKSGSDTSNSSFATSVMGYYTTTAGFVMRFGIVEVDALTTIMFGQDFIHASARYSLGIGLHFPFIQW